VAGDSGGGQARGAGHVGQQVAEGLVAEPARLGARERGQDEHGSGELEDLVHHVAHDCAADRAAHGAGWWKKLGRRIVGS